MTRTRSQTLGLFLLAALFSFAANFGQHRFQPVVEPDFDSYRNYDWSTWTAVLSNVRTFGYPLFVTCVCAVSDHPRAIPLAHWLTLVFAAFLLQAGLTAAGMRRGVALACAATLLLDRAMLRFGNHVIADSVAGSLAVAATGSFLATLAPRFSRWGWCALTLLTFLSYQCRPAYLCLIPLWPLLGGGLAALLLDRDATWKALVRRISSYALATGAPFVLFCTLRWAIVGHWGLVSFGGYNLIGIVGQFLDPATAAALPADLQPLAQRMLQRASQIEHYERPTNFHELEQRYNPTVWQIAVPAAIEIHGDDPVKVNTDLSRLGRELLLRHPGQYARSLVWNGVHAIQWTVILTVTDKGTQLLCLLCLVVHAWSLWRGPRGTGRPYPERCAIRYRESHLLFWTAASFAAAKISLVMLVEPTMERYMTGAMTLLPCAIAVFVAHYAETMFRASNRAE